MALKILCKILEEKNLRFFSVKSLHKLLTTGTFFKNKKSRSGVASL